VPEAGVGCFLAPGSILHDLIHWRQVAGAAFWRHKPARVPWPLMSDTCPQLMVFSSMRRRKKKSREARNIAGEVADQISSLKESVVLSHPVVPDVERDAEHTRISNDKK